MEIATTQAPIQSNINGRVQKRQVQGSVRNFNVKGDQTSFYIVNYKGGGFVLISADKRTTPILAYSDTGNFEGERIDMPRELLGWLESVEETIKEIRSNNDPQSQEIIEIWNKYAQQEIVNREKSESGRSNSTIYIGDCNNGDSGFMEYSESVVSTPNWGQGSGYNNSLSYAGCSNTSNGRYLTGCVATAVAEVMRFYSYPSFYNWSAMPFYSGSDETSRLMRDLGTSGNLSVSYGCNASSASSDNTVRTFFNFGYHQARYSDFDIWNAKGELQMGRPILLRGRPGVSFDDFTPNGHLWVADGVQYYGYYSCVPDPNTPGEWMAIYNGYDCSMRMNWGWNGGYNGWYFVNNFNPAGRNYNNGRKMVWGIRP